MEWLKAEKHMYETKDVYEEIGTPGLFGLMFINEIVARFESGERTKSLYDEIMEME